MTEIKGVYEATAQEFKIFYGGWSYLVIYGEHVNGWYCAIPNWGISVEIGSPYKVDYNAKRIGAKFTSEAIGTMIAEAIKEHWEVSIT